MHVCVHAWVRACMWMHRGDVDTGKYMITLSLEGLVLAYSVKIWSVSCGGATFPALGVCDHMTFLWFADHRAILEVLLVTLSSSFKGRWLFFVAVNYALACNEIFKHCCWTMDI